jgi:hypothetical protein
MYRYLTYRKGEMKKKGFIPCAKQLRRLGTIGFIRGGVGGEDY